MKFRVERYDLKITKAAEIIKQFEYMKDKYNFCQFDIRKETNINLFESMTYPTNDIRIIKDNYSNLGWPLYTLTIGGALGLFRVELPLNSKNSEEGIYWLAMDEPLEWTINDRFALYEQKEDGSLDMAIYFRFFDRRTRKD